MDFRLFGVGPGVIILVLLWSSTLLISISFGKTHGITTIIGISILSTLLSLLLIYWPIEQLEMLNSTVTEITHYDHVFIPRLLLPNQSKIAIIMEHSTNSTEFNDIYLL
ncbi:hypothetical protein V3C99_017455 [Haemonchus contortus]